MIKADLAGEIASWRHLAATFYCPCMDADVADTQFKFPG
jgi:hypothetical protein